MADEPDYEKLGRQHGEAEGKRALEECLGRGSPYVKEWWQGYVGRLESHIDEMQAEGVVSLDCLAFAKASQERLTGIIDEIGERVGPAAAAAKQNRAARRIAKARARKLH